MDIRIVRFWQVFKQAGLSWIESRPFRLGAIVAYFALLSLPALMVIIVTILGILWEGQTIEQRLISEIANYLGKDSSEAIKQMLEAARSEEKSLFLSILGIITLIYGSTGVFFHLQKSLNQIWKVDSGEDYNWLQIVKDRLVSFGFVLVLGFLLLISFFFNALLSSIGDELRRHLPDIAVLLIYLSDIILNLGFMTLLFALIFKFLPKADVRWPSVWLGAFVTSILFVLGELALGYYFMQFEPESSYGAAGSIILILLWVSYASLILFYGAEVTYQYARIFGHGIGQQKTSQKG